MIYIENEVNEARARHNEQMGTTLTKHQQYEIKLARYKQLSYEIDLIHGHIQRPAKPAPLKDIDDSWLMNAKEYERADPDDSEKD